MRRILITGVNGFVGKHLVKELKTRGLDVIGVSREEVADPQIAPLLSKYFLADLTNPNDVKKIELENISSVISLAGLAKVGDSFSNPEIYKKINVEVLSVLAEEIISRNLNIRIVAISTGAVYSAKQAMPLTENSNLISEGSPYALSKILMEKKAEELRRNKLNCIVVRPFNHIGPGQEPGFLLPDLYQKIREAEKTSGVLKIGNLKTMRDYTDVRDVVSAYANLATSNTLHNTLYNVCSGRSLAGEEILKLLLETMDLTGKIKTIEDPNLLRPNDPMNIYGSYERLKLETNWQPKIPIEQTIKDIVAQSI